VVASYDYAGDYALLVEAPVEAPWWLRQTISVIVLTKSTELNFLR
jgi:hypothetical protein